MQTHLTAHFILGIHVTDRAHHVAKLQQTLTRFGGIIRTRLGLHEVSSDRCAPNGLILLELATDAAGAKALAAALQRIRGVEVKLMVFRHG